LDRHGTLPEIFSWHDVRADLKYNKLLFQLLLDLPKKRRIHLANKSFDILLLVFLSILGNVIFIPPAILATQSKQKMGI
jgi:hypothetical protein